MKVLIICGHGNGDCGAVSKIDGKTYRESEITRDFARRLYKKMKSSGIDTVLYDTSKNAYSELCKNSKNIIFKGYDIVLEIHVNSSINNDYVGNGKNIGTEIFVPSLSNNTKNEYAKKIVESVSSVGLKNRGVKVGKFQVINTAYSSGVKNAFLLELFFINDKDDLLLYQKNKTKIINNIVNIFKKDSFLFKITSKKASVYIDIEDKIKSAITVKQNEVFTIVETKKCLGINYGKLKSGLGWIPLNCGVVINGK